MAKLTEEQKARQREYYRQNREKIRLAQRAYYSLDEVKQARRNKELQKYYGIDLKTYKQMLEAQNHRCALCKTPEEEITRGLHVDHCHRTGAVRGLLCSPCNQALGLLKDDPDLMSRAIQYVSKKS